MATWYLESASHDPAFNLALEQYVFDDLPRDRSYLMLWRNGNAVIVGKYQNTVQEIDADYVRTHGIKVVRRLSGGGAVYHDLGNLNFTFIPTPTIRGRWTSESSAARWFRRWTGWA
jgi:lipoate-protein ligase A